MKRVIMCALCVILFLSITTSAWACPGINGFCCRVEEENMPVGAVYVDLLLPISSADEEYTPYNASVGQKFAIAEDSEIVRYSEGGYQSYAFHIKNAQPSIAPEQACNLVMDAELFKKETERRDLFTSMHFGGYASEDKTKVFVRKKVAYLSEDKAKIDAFCAQHNLQIECEPYLHLYYATNMDGTACDFESYIKKYKYAKVAYLDAEGNILAVTKKGKMHHKGLFVSKYAEFYLSGTELTVDVQMGISSFGAAVLIGIVLILFIGFITLCIYFVYWLIRHGNKPNFEPWDYK